MLALGVATVAFFVTQRIWERLEGLLNAFSWSRLLLVCAVEIVGVLAVARFSAALTSSLAAGDSPGADRPNIMLIVLDTVRADALSSSGNILADTPPWIAWPPGRPFLPSHLGFHLDASGACQPFHQSVPALARHSRIEYHAGPRPNVLPSILSKAGYASVSLYNNPLAGRGNDIDRGFDVSIGVETDKKVSFIDQRLYYKYVLEESGVRRLVNFFTPGSRSTTAAECLGWLSSTSMMLTCPIAPGSRG